MNSHDISFVNIDNDLFIPQIPILCLIHFKCNTTSKIIINTITDILKNNQKNNKKYKFDFNFNFHDASFIITIENSHNIISKYIINIYNEKCNDYNNNKQNFNYVVEFNRLYCDDIFINCTMQNIFVEIKNILCDKK